MSVINKKLITKMYGKKCISYADECATCRVWFLWDNLNGYIKLVQEAEKEIEEG